MSTEEEMKEIEQIHFDAHEHDDDERCVASNVLAIGSICMCKWWLAMKSGCIYVPFPLDNVKDTSVYQFENVRMLIQQRFKQIRPDVLEYTEVKGSRLFDGKQVEYHGFKYIGDELHQPLWLSHFYDTGAGDAWLSDEEAWKRWDHKVDRTMAAINDSDTPLNIVSYRRDDTDGYYKRDYLARSARRLAQLIKDRRGHSFKLISLIEAPVEKETTEVDEEHFTQIVFPAGSQRGKSFWERQEIPRHLEALKEHLI